ncbi:CobW family GTP-binding protein [Martelella alba]|uniref:GTP-binding protein n=1 Tax=Martelella alba TaxID=2590451 RepID=A0ABY2SGK2_9HYPH|nr:GTP-binding protein [Martelella alba]TKI04296.1 GTP-binding protein [Martelella alba]
MAIEAKHDERIPVVLLTGFLGSGKTSLLNHWLKEPALADAAVIVNELGEIGIDHQLIASSNENTIELSTGCLCCMVTGDLVDTLRELFVRRQRGDCRRFGKVIIETTGLAEPGPVIQVLMTQPVVAKYRLSNVVTTLDAVKSDDTLNTYPEAVKQLALADRVVITKLDLLPAEQQNTPLARCRAVNPGAPVFLSSNSQMPAAESVLNGIDYSSRISSDQISSWLNWRPLDEGKPVHHAIASFQQDKHSHGINNFYLTIDEPFHWEHLSAWLDALTLAHGKQLLRVKGICWIKNQDKPIVIHVVQGLFHPPTVINDKVDQERISRIVFITQGLSKKYIDDVLAVIRAKKISAA